jgi:hypothetical protein
MLVITRRQVAAKVKRIRPREEEGGENAARFHLGDFLSLAKPIQFICNAKDSAAGMKKRP